MSLHLRTLRYNSGFTFQVTLLLYFLHYNKKHSNQFFYIAHMSLMISNLKTDSSQSDAVAAILNSELDKMIIKLMASTDQSV